MDLHRFFRADRFSADRPAVITREGSMTYGEMIERSLSLDTDGISHMDFGPDCLTMIYACLMKNVTLIPIPRGEELPPYDEMIRKMPEGTAMLLFTSGSSGKPKGVCLSLDNILSDMRAITEKYRHEEGSLYLHVMPFTHIFGIISSLVALYEGCTLCLGGGLGSMAMDIRYFSPYAVDTVPEAAEYLLGRIEHDPKATGGKLRVIACGGAQVREETISGFSRYGIKVYGCYGMTECASCVSFADGEATPGCAGRPLSCNEVMICDDGQIYVRGSNVMLGYLDGDRRRFCGGWFKTGDTGFINSKGELVVTGRADGIFVLGSGRNITFSELRTILLENKAVKDAVIRHFEGRAKIFVCCRGKNSGELPLELWIKSKLGDNVMNSVLILNEEEYYREAGKIKWRES